MSESGQTIYFLQIRNEKVDQFTARIIIKVRPTPLVSSIGGKSQSVFMYVLNTHVLRDNIYTVNRITKLHFEVWNNGGAKRALRVFENFNLCKDESLKHPSKYVRVFQSKNKQLKNCTRHKSICETKYWKRINRG